ncbi:N-acetyllactosaminide beta-1,6-N-acetylglucosaminyl-transferase-like [Littorina saxatilis]|uniref:Uncharacterized protein n=1 Tax=Littorina saxatilis TaxID=31220 RepID=A0AAN9BW97_9CAEN
MVRCGRRWKLAVCPVLLTVCALYVLQIVLLHSGTQTAPRSLGLGHNFWKERGGSADSRRTFTLFDPFSRDYSDSVGLKGLQGFDCVAAIEGFPVSFDQKPSAPVVGLSENTLTERTGDCQSFRERHGYRRYRQPSEEEVRFPLAFNVLLYKDVEQLHVLLRAIYRPHNSYCLHVDGHAAPKMYESTRRLASCLPNVFLASRRENITYAGFSRLQADINCMEDHWKSPVAWMYLINLPSQQFPLKTNMELVKILTVYNGSNDIEGLVGDRMLKQRFTFKHVYLPDGATGRLKLERTKDKHEDPPHGIKVVKGSAYGVFSRGFVDFVLHDQRAKDLLNWCRPVSSPDEYYWATLHHNPHLHVPGGYQGAPDKKPWLAVYASWIPRDPCHSGKTTRGICIFGARDLPQLVARKELFANKFYLDFQPQALHCLDQWLVNKSRAALPFDTLYYRQLPFVKK